MKYFSEVLGVCVLIFGAAFWSDPEAFGDRVGRFVAAFNAAESE
jgi:hypothetical protein